MRTVGTRIIFGLMVSTLMLAASAGATVSVPSIIGDHMVLQAGKPLPIWGKAAPGEAVTVTLNGHSEKATADENGKWKVKLPKMHTGGPIDMSIAGKDNTITVKDILIGEVWIGSGQSNMQFNTGSAINGADEAAKAKYPKIRLFSVALTVAQQPQDDCKGAWVECTPESVNPFSAVLYFFGRDLHTKLNVPVGLIHTSWGGTPCESWVSRPALEAQPDLKVIADRWDKLMADYPAAKVAYDKSIADWKEACAKAKAAGQKEPGKPGEPAGPGNPGLASGLYNAMIAPLVPYAIQGAVWYQGESNASRAFQYRNLFSTMIKDWRKNWDQGPFSFYFVQLANFTPQLDKPADSEWAELREAQNMALALENTGEAVIIDIGDANDIHPKNKQDVGKRLALNALNKDYGKHDVVYSGPMYKKMQVVGNHAALAFTHTDGGLAAKGGKLKGFAIAGADKKFVWADAVIEGNHINVSSPSVTQPVAVRYAWANNPDCNLYNGAGLPASPFRTDDWPGVTVNNK